MCVRACALNHLMVYYVILEYSVAPPGNVLDAVQISSDYVSRLKLHQVGSIVYCGVKP